MAKKYGRSTKARSKRGTSFGRKKTGKKSYLKPYKKFAKNVRQIAKKVIASQAEDKIITYPITLYNGSLGAPGMVPLNWESRTIFVPGSGLSIDGLGTNPYSGVLGTPLLAITQGLTQADRTGNCIRPKKFLLRGVIQTDLNQYSTVAPGGTWSNVVNNIFETPFVCHMLIYKRKDSLWGQGSYDPSRILNTGVGAGRIDGSLIADLYPFNTDAYTIIKHKTFKMQNQPFSQISGNVTADGWGNGFKQAHSFKIYVPVKKVWKYDDTNTSGNVPANFPVNDNFYVAFWNTNCDNSKVNIYSPGNIVYSRCTVTMQTVMNFEDF